MIGDVLDWAAGEGFGAVAEELGLKDGHRTAREFRERYLVAALAGRYTGWTS